MMIYTVLEDCSPYYIRFTHAGINNVIDKCLKYVRGAEFTKKFTHYKYPDVEARSILQDVPAHRQLTLAQRRVSLFVTQPGAYYPAHKDGIDYRYGINYNIKILDDKCVTSWYADEDLDCYPAIDPNTFMNASREREGFSKHAHTPIKTMVAVQGEAVLFNTDIYHDFDNSLSDNERMVLTLRDRYPSNIYFEDVRQRLFGI